jgi:hypothetical protein
MGRNPGSPAWVEMKRGSFSTGGSEPSRKLWYRFRDQPVPLLRKLRIIGELCETPSTGSDNRNKRAHPNAQSPLQKFLARELQVQNNAESVH